MVDKIFSIKAKVLERMERSIGERGVERMDIAEMEKLADVVKDLSEAEKECWEAEYYHAVTDAMGGGSMGYEDAATRDRRGYANGGSQGVPPSGYTYQGGRSGYRDSMGRYAQNPNRGYMPYGYDPMQVVREAMETATPEDKERMKQEMRVLSGM